MKSFYSTFIVLLLIAGTAICPNDFEKYFLNETMRIDYHHLGDSEVEFISIDKIYRYGIWAGSIFNLVDNLNNGKYYVKIYDLVSNELIYSKGYDTYFGEYQTGSEAQAGIKKTFHETVLIPFPKYKIRFAIERRDKENVLFEIFSTEVNPDDVSIVNEKIEDDSVILTEDKNNGDPHTRVDIAILGDGYTANETEKFEEDFRRVVKSFFGIEPYKSNKDKFNFYGVLKPSLESGTDEPRAKIYKNTVLGTTFNSLGSERYLLTENNKIMRDIASIVPYDAIVLIINHSRYGGGGIYNLFCTLTSDNQWFDYLLLHEFGHSFSGLADEYYTSDVAYNDFYKIDVEPVEPNLTALIDPENFKWKELVDEGINVPTLWEKSEFDSIDLKWQEERHSLNERIAELKRKKESAASIKNLQELYNMKDKEHAVEIDNFLKKSKYWGKIGAFEGAGYLSHGLYRPMVDCIMFSKGKKPYCKVCEMAVLRVINMYSQ